MEFEQQIRQLTSSVWESIVHRTAEPEPGPLPTGERTMSSCVHITGEWQGVLALSCDPGMAAEAAGEMFGTPSASQRDMEDALGELVNMIGGNVKALLPGSCNLSLPSIVNGSNYTICVPGSRIVAQVAMRCGPHVLGVSLMQKAA